MSDRQRWQRALYFGAVSVILFFAIFHLPFAVASSRPVGWIAERSVAWAEPRVAAAEKEQGQQQEDRVGILDGIVRNLAQSGTRAVQGAFHGTLKLIAHAVAWIVVAAVTAVMLFLGSGTCFVLALWNVGRAVFYP